MNLFFETGNQTAAFLSAVPIGFTLALCLDLNRMLGWIAFLLDFLLLLAAGISAVMLLLYFNENALRLYHLLGACTGAVLYASGIGRIYQRLLRHKTTRAMQESDLG